ncbi:MAG: Rrf2 family transcriptional regulator [Deltaproteobacteria bacterium]|nr:Rrf2 family transcriptional regulator [Deltaproteobacteria bacterium]
MILTKAGEYALRCMIYLAAHADQGITTRRDVAQAMNIPTSFLAKIAQRLARVGLLQIVQGARGGYRLLKPAIAISMLEVVEAVEGEIFLNECLLRKESCSRVGTCKAHIVWSKARTNLRATLQQATLADLLSSEEATSGSDTSDR